MQLRANKTKLYQLVKKYMEVSEVPKFTLTKFHREKWLNKWRFGGTEIHTDKIP